MITKKKINKIIIGSCLILIGIVLLWMYINSWHHNNIIIPAWRSTQTTCTIKSQTIDDFQAYAQDKGFIIQGAYNPINDTIIIVEEYVESEEEFEMIMRHEECHRKQHQENRAHGCTYTIYNRTFDTRLFLFLDEIECYLAQYSY